MNCYHLLQIAVASTVLLTFALGKGDSQFASVHHDALEIVNLIEADKMTEGLERISE